MGGLVASIIGLVGVLIVGSLLVVGLRGEGRASSNSMQAGVRFATRVAFIGMACALVMVFVIAWAANISHDSRGFFVLFIAGLFVGGLPGMVVGAVTGLRNGKKLREGSDHSA